MTNGYDGGNTTGFASPTSDSLEGPIDLSDVLDLRRPHRYPVRPAPARSCAAVGFRPAT